MRNSGSFRKLQSSSLLSSGTFTGRLYPPPLFGYELFACPKAAGSRRATTKSKLSALFAIRKSQDVFGFFRIAFRHPRYQHSKHEDLFRNSLLSGNVFVKQQSRLQTLVDSGRCVRRLVIAFMALVPERPISGVRSGSVDRLEQCAKQLGCLPHRLRGLGLETVHQKAVAVIVVVEDPPQVLPGRQAPLPLQLGRNRTPADGRDPMIFHSGDG
jgi:hypothetical protein